MTRRTAIGALLSGAFLSTTVSAAAPVAPARTLVFEKVEVNDPWVNDILATTFLKPKGWKFEGGMKWYPNFCHQVCFEASVYDPNSLEQYQALPWNCFTWISKPIFPLQRMGNYMGCLVLEPTVPSEYVERLILPLHRKGLKPRIVSRHEMPEVAKAMVPTAAPTVKAVRVRVEYVLDGSLVEEDFYIVLGYTSMTDVYGCTYTIWSPVMQPFALRAAKGQLDAATPRLLTVAHSGKINPGWADAVAYVQWLFAKRMNMAIADAAELSKRITRNSDYIRDLLRSSYEYRGRVQDRAAKNFSDYIRGVQDYTGGGYTYSLPNTYQYAWSGTSGYIIMTNDPNYNPNIGGTASWTLLKPVGS